MKNFSAPELISSKEIIEANIHNTPMENHFPKCNPFEKITYSTDNCKTNRTINTKSLQIYANKCDTVLYRCDWITALCKEDTLKYCPIFSVPNDTNSSDKFLPMEDFLSSQILSNGESISNNGFTVGDTNIQIIEWATLTKTIDTPDEEVYMLNVVYEWNTFPIMRFWFYSANSPKFRQNRYRAKLDIYWKAFRLEDITGWAFSVKNFLYCLFARYYDSLDILKRYYITRYDYKFDFFTPKGENFPSYIDIFRRKRKSIWERKNVWLEIQKRGNRGNCPYWITNSKGELCTGWSLWKKKDQYIYTRLYHKQVEIFDNNLGDLYRDYLDYEWEIRRLEFEFGSRFCWARGNVFLFDELSNWRLSRIVYEYLWITPKNWYFSKKYKLSIPFEKKSALQKKRMYSMYLNTTKQYKDNNINPFAIVSLWMNDKEIKYYLDNLDKDRKVLWDILPKINPSPYKLESIEDLKKYVQISAWLLDGNDRESVLESLKDIESATPEEQQELIRMIKEVWANFTSSS